MGFGGGGTSAVTAHVHTNAAGQGGNLTDATLIKMGTDTPYELHKIMPVGTMVLWGGTRASIPDRFIECDGASLARVGTFAELFAVIGTQFGSVDGDSFNAPDMDEMFGRGSPNANDSGGTGGADSVTLSTAQIPAHVHGIGVGVNTAGNPFKITNLADTDAGNINSKSAGGGGSHENRPAFVESVYIIRF